MRRTPTRGVFSWRKGVGPHPQTAPSTFYCLCTAIHDNIILSPVCIKHAFVAQAAHKVFSWRKGAGPHPQILTIRSTFCCLCTPIHMLIPDCISHMCGVSRPQPLTLQFCLTSHPGSTPHNPFTPS